MMRSWIVLFLLVCRLGAQTVGVSLVNRDTRAITVTPESPAAVTFSADPSLGGGDLFQIVLSKPGSTLSMVLPDGNEMNSSNAPQGYTFTVVPKGAFNDSYIPSPLAVNGYQTLIQLPASAPPGQYSLRVDAAQSDGPVLVIASYFSSSPVRAGLVSNAPGYTVGDTVVLSGFVFDGSQPMASASAVVRIVDPQDPTSVPVEVKLNDSGAFDDAPGDGVYTGTFKPDKPGSFTAALRVSGTSNSGLNFSRTATTIFRVDRPLAKFDALRDFAVDDDGDGVIDRVALNARISADTEGSYQFVGSLVTAGGARLQSKGILSLTKGSNEVTLYFPGASVTALGEDGPYAITDVLLLYQDDPEEPLADSIPDAGKTAAYAIRGRITGLQPTPAQLDFGSIGNGSTKDLAVTIKNAGATPLLEGVLPTNSTAFTVMNPKSPLAVAAGEQQSITVRFAPTTTGSFSGRLVVAGMAIPLSGSSISGPAIDTSPATLDFGSVATGQTKDLTFSVNNRGTANLVVSSVTSSDPQFAVTPGGGFTVAPSAAQTVTIRFAPGSAGAKSASINVASNDSTRPTASVTVSGSGIQGTTSAPAIGVTPSVLDFGNVTVSQTKDLSLTINNTGSAALSISALTVTGVAFRVVSPAAPLTIAASGSQIVTVRFSPASAGQQTGTLVIASNDAARRSVTVNLTGTGAGSSTASTVLSVDDGTFELSTGLPDGSPAVYFLNRLTPPSYPATLKNVQIAFVGASDSLKEGDSIRILVATNPSGASALNNVQFLAATMRVGPGGRFSSYDAPALTISSGDFLVGFVTVNPPNIYPAALDTTPPSRQRSYVSLDGVTFSLLESVGSGGNFGIRAVVETGQAAAAASPGEAREFNPLAPRLGSRIDLRDSLRRSRSH